LNDKLFPNVARVDEIIDGWQSKSIAVLGDVMLDHYVWGSVERISPEAPVPVVEVKDETYLLGGAANVALNLKKLGCNPFVAGIIGDDSAGGELNKLFSILGVDGSGIEIDQYRPTTIKTRIVANNQQVVRADREEKREIDSDLERRMFERLESRIDDISGLIISDYGKGIITSSVLKKIIKLCRDHGVFIAVDPKDVHFRSYKQVSVITPNHLEASFAYGLKIRDEETLKEVGFGLIRMLELESILITRGAEGMALFKNDGTLHLLPTVAQKVFDVTGAGDTVISTFTAAAAGGGSLLEAAFLSNQAAGVVVGEVGTAQVDAETLRRVTTKYIEKSQ